MEKKPKGVATVRKKRPAPIVVERDEFMARPNHWAAMASTTQIVKVRDREGAVALIFGGRL